MSEGTVNSQIVDSVSNVVTLTGGQAPAQAFAMLDTVMIETLGMAMYNAVSRQQGASMIGSAAVTAACAKMLGTPFGVAAPPPVPPIPDPLPPHGVQPLEPVPKSPATIIAEATADMADAVARLRDEEAAAERNVAAARAATEGLVPPAVAPSAAAAKTPGYFAPGMRPTAAATDPTSSVDPAPVAKATTTAISITSQTVPVNLADKATEPPVPPPLR